MKFNKVCFVCCRWVMGDHKGRPYNGAAFFIVYYFKMTFVAP